MVRVTHRPTDFSVLIRAFGRKSEILIDRKQEIIVSTFFFLWGKEKDEKDKKRIIFFLVCFVSYNSNSIYNNNFY